MDTSASAAELPLKQCLSVVEDVFHITSTPLDPTSLLTTLLRLCPCLESSCLTPEDLSVLRRKIWQLDLVHLMVEALRHDYSNESEEWRMLTDLAATLASVLAGLAPKEKGTMKTLLKSPAKEDHVWEYYDILLPTATDSILILANGMLEVVEEDRLPTDPSLNLHECFKQVVDSLVWLCSTHKCYVPRALQSPYLMMVLISDHALYSHTMLEVLGHLVRANPDALSLISEDVLASILDELVYRLCGSDREGAELSLLLLGEFSAILPDLIDTLCSNYVGLLSLAERWLGKDRDRELSAEEEFLLSKLRARAAEEGRDVEEMDTKQRAASLIQAVWRGHASRKKMKTVQRGIRRFQLAFRRRKAKMTEQKETQAKVEVEAMVRQSQLQSSQLAFREKQLSAYEQLPASELQEFVEEQERKASIVIQSAWRGYVARVRYEGLKGRRREEASLVRSAITIQRAFRRHLARKRDAAVGVWRWRGYCPLPKLSEMERSELQDEVTRRKDAHQPPPPRTQEQLSALHQEAQREYERFLFSCGARARQHQEIRQLITKLNRNCELLLTAPSLQESYGRELTSTFSSASPEVARMARTAHREEMRAMSLPWWKREPLDHTELSL